MTCASVTIRLRGLMYVNLANQSVTYVSGTFVTLDSGLNTLQRRGKLESPALVLPIPKPEEPILKDQKFPQVLLFSRTWESSNSSLTLNIST